MLIEGPIEEIIFRNDENGYTVFLIDFKGALTTCVGKLVNANIGENLSLDGEFVNNNKYGLQFAFTNYEVVLPTSLSGIEKYLSSGLIKGVGPVTAKNIVQTFKEQTFDIIEMSPSSLAEIKNISMKKALEIGEKFKELKKMQNSIMFLQKYNISTNMAMKIYEYYGENTINLVQSNPYRLVENIDGIGFLSADKIAKSLGIPSESEFRIRAGILYSILNSTEKTGNTYLPKKNLLSICQELLEIKKETFENLFDNALDGLVLDKTMMKFWKDNVEVIMLTKYYFYENSVAQKLSILALTQNIEKQDLNDLITHFEEKNKISFHDEQKNAIITALNNGVTVITGGPGTGKTTIVKCIIELLKQQKQRYILMAPTGRASKRLSDSTQEDAKTIHRALEVTQGQSANKFFYNENNPLKTDAVIIDEMSMVDVALMSSLCKALPRQCRLILVGDKDQLPSVGAGNVLDDIIKSQIIPVCVLSKIFRQSDNSLIITNAHLINNGKMPIIDNHSLDFFFEEKESLDDIKKSVVDLVTTRLPNFTKEDPSQIQVLAPLKAGVCGITNLNKILQSYLNPPSVKKLEHMVGDTIFREGDKVMQTANNYNLVWTKMNNFIEEQGEGIFNGDIGYIIKIDYQNGETIVEFEDGRICTYPRTEISQLSLAYAITIHKSQGSEFNTVVIPIIAGAPMILTRNLIYTAVTRAKKMVVLVGEKKNLKKMVSNNYTVQRFTMLKKLLIDAQTKIKELYE